MKKNSIRKNLVFNFIRSIMSIIFPVITFSYSSRILLPGGIGKINFSQSVISYFALMAAFGINMYGMREAARLRDDKKQLSKFVSEILCINLLSTILSYLLMFITINSVDKLAGYKSLILIYSLTLFLTTIGMEWLYNALEEFEYITIRTVVIQVISLILVFYFVKKEEDFVKYALISVFASSSQNIINFVHIRQYIKFDKNQKMEFKKHLNPIFWLFGMALTVNLFTNMDTTMLGFLANDRAVGLYETGVKINKMSITLITSVGVVIMPRLSYYIEKRQSDKFQNLVKKAFNIEAMLIIPVTVGLFLLSNQIISIFSGSDFASAAVTMRILTPIVVMIPYNYLINTQIFIPLRKEKAVLFSTGLGAVVNFVGNWILIPIYNENGAALATVITEFAVLLICIYNMKRYLHIQVLEWKIVLQYLIAVVPFFVLNFVLKKCLNNDFLKILIMICGCGTLYFSILVMFKNKEVCEGLDIIRQKFKNRNV